MKTSTIKLYFIKKKTFREILRNWKLDPLDKEFQGEVPSINQVQVRLVQNFALGYCLLAVEILDVKVVNIIFDQKKKL